MTRTTMVHVKRHLAKARREMTTAVERFAAVTDPLEGHRIEAARLAREIRSEADSAIKALER